MLRGYAQVGVDIIAGPEGHAAFGDVPAGHDGAYVSVVQGGEDGSAVIGTDDTGYARLFIYRDIDKWAIGSSLVDLAEFVSERAWPLSINEAQFKTFLLKSRGMLGNQLTSLGTSFNEIRLLAPSEYAVIRNTEFPSLEVSQRAPKLPTDYPTALKDALDEMTGRLRTLIRSGLPVVSDITGGRDSRTVLAALRVADDTTTPLSDVVRFRSSERIEEDWVIAKPLSEKYGLRVNRATQESTFGVDPDYAFQMWRSNDLGAYAPLYLFKSYSDEIALNGAAGGVHRSVYRKATMADQLRAMRTDYLTEDDLVALTDSMEQSLDHVGGHDDRRLEHFRLFRNRFHGGRNALRTLSVAPLGSAKLRHASSLMSDEHLDRAQFYADVMYNLAPDLADEPYDSPKKGWDDRHRNELTLVNVEPGRFVGRLYGRPTPPPERRSAERKHLEPFYEAFLKAAPRAVESRLLPSEYVAAAQQTLEAAKDGALKHAVDGVPISTVILAGEAVVLANHIRSSGS